MRLFKLSCYFFYVFIPEALASVKLSHFYPYGKFNKDRSVDHVDDGSSGIVHIAMPFPFFDEDHTSLYVNTNGAISFLKEVTQYTPDAFPLGNNRRLITPYWADVDIRNGGEVYYRETQDFRILTRVSTEVRKYFVRQRRFKAKWAMVITWLDVARYHGSGSTTNNKRNTFQVVLSTNGVSSFAIFLYNKLHWIYGTASSNTPAQAGFNAGDGVRYFSIPNSRTPAVGDITSTSNVGVPGKWIFQVDGEIVKKGGCDNKGGELVLSPRSGIELGGTKVFIGGPCFSPADVIVCRFNKSLQTYGAFISRSESYCVTPPLYASGLIPVDVSLDNGKTFTFQGAFRSIPLGRNSPDVEGLNIDKWIKSLPVQISWDPKIMNAFAVDIDILVFDSAYIRLLNESVISNKNVHNRGRFRLNLPDATRFVRPARPEKTKNKKEKKDSKKETPLAIVRITPSPSRKKQSPGSKEVDKVKIYSKIFLLRLLVQKMTCSKWYFKDSESHQVHKLQEELTPCPTSLQGILADRGTFRPDKGVKHFLRSHVHRAREECFRSVNPSASGAGQQCCYDVKGELVVGPVGGGTFDLISPDRSFEKHFYHDVLPWFLCCELSNNFDKYYERRPSDDGSRYIPPPIAATSGDPHLVTFDGVSYTFNGQGEYVLLKIVENINLTFQGRMEPITDSRGQKTRATALTALVVKEAASDIVQIELNPRRVMDVFVNGDRVDFDEQVRLDFTGVFVIRQNRSKLSVFLNSGVSIDVTATEDLLTYQITIPVQFKEKTSGLLGFWDDDTAKEFLLPTGNFIPTNSSSKVLHYEFGLKWIVDKNTTLFSYRQGKDYENYANLGFTPVFIDESPPSFANSTLENEAKEVCGDNKECLFDIALSGKTSVGKTTLNSINDLQERANNTHVVLQPVRFGCDGIKNSNKTLDACGVCGGNNSTCTDCNGVVRPGVVINETCEPIHFGCDGIKDSNKSFDACGVCGGNNSTCTDCDGIVRPGIVMKKTCEKSFIGCDGVKGSNKTLDACGVCGGDNSSCTDCNGNLRPGGVYNKSCDEPSQEKSGTFYFLIIGLPLIVLFILVILILSLYFLYRRRPARKQAMAEKEDLTRENPVYENK